MLNLLQSSFKIDRKKGIQLEAIKEVKSYICRHYDNEVFVYENRIYPEQFVCHKCGKFHEVLYKFWRKPADTFGAWLVFRVNGIEIVPDLSVPLSLEKMPRDAVKMTEEENSIAWHN